MDIEKPTQRKTVQWQAQQFKAIVLEQNVDFRKKVLEFQHKHAQDENEQNQSDNSEQFQQKSQKTIQIQKNLKKAKINRVSQQVNKMINLKQLNRRISMKQNIDMDQEQSIDEQQMKKKEQFSKKREMYCNQRFSMKRHN